MPRKARIDAPGALHHVIVRGIERRKIFRSDYDRVAERVAEVTSMGIEKVTAFGKSPQTVKARGLLCFWAHRKLGMITIEIGKRLHLSQSAVSRLSKGVKQLQEKIGLS